MTDFAPLLQADRGGPAHAIHLMDKNSFAEWAKKQSAARRALLEAARYEGKTAFQFAILPATQGHEWEVVSTVANAAELSPWQLGDGWVRDVVVAGGGVSIEVQTHASPALRNTILASVRQVVTDLNGCPATQPVNSTGWVRPTRGLDLASAVTGLSICRYDTRTADWSLIASVSKDQAGANRVLGLIRSAPARGGPDDLNSLASLGDELTVLRFQTANGVREVYVRYAGYRHNGFDTGTQVRRLTHESVSFMTGPLVVYGGPQVTLNMFPRR